MIQENKRPVTVEDLLRLKRCEQPTTEFWAEFDRTLRAKQLSALVEKRPWWQRLPRAALASWRYSLPVGGAAALALTLLSVRHDAPVDSTLPQSPAIAAAVASPAVVEAMAPAASDATAPLPAESHAPVAVAMDAEPAPAAISPAKETPVVAVAEEVGASSSLASVLGLDMTNAAAEKSIQAVSGFAAAPASDLSLTGGLLAGAAVNEPVVAATPTAVVASARSRVDPLSQMTVPSRSRLSAQAIAAVASYFPEGPAEQVTERQAKSLSNERLYEGPKSRVKANGDRFSLGM